MLKGTDVVAAHSREPVAYPIDANGVGNLLAGRNDTCIVQLDLVGHRLKAVVQCLHAAADRRQHGLVLWHMRADPEMLVQGRVHLRHRGLFGQQVVGAQHIGMHRGYPVIGIDQENATASPTRWQGGLELADNVDIAQIDVNNQAGVTI